MNKSDPLSLISSPINRSLAKPLLAINDDGEVSSDSDEKQKPQAVEMGNYRSGDDEQELIKLLEDNDSSISLSDFSDLEIEPELL